MIKVTLAQETLAKLRHITQSIEIYDEEGIHLGTAYPRPGRLPDGYVEPEISEEEIALLVNEPGGRPLAEILADLRQSDPPNP